MCAFLANFHPALVPLAKEPSEDNVDKYFEQLSDCDSDLEASSDTDRSIIIFCLSMRDKLLILISFNYFFVGELKNILNYNN